MQRALESAKRLGVMGGSFDPIHHGHLTVAQEVAHRLNLDYVIFVPTNRSPFKLHNTQTSSETRYAMLELALAPNPRFALSDLEINRAGPSYTVDTLATLNKNYPGANLYFIIGSDAVGALCHWKDPHRIIALAGLAVVGRPGGFFDLHELETRLPGVSKRVDLVDVPQLAISATDLRRRVVTGAPITYQVPPAVEEYIARNKLYKGIVE